MKLLIRIIALIYIKLILACLFWVGTFVAGKELSNLDVSPGVAGLLRFALAAIIFFSIAITLRSKQRIIPKKGEWPLLLILGMSGIAGYMWLFLKGLQYIPASRATMIIALNPVAIGTTSALFFKEELGMRRIFGFLIAIIGSLTAIIGHNPDALGTGFGIGELCILGCVLCWTTYSLVGKLVMKQLSPLVSNTWAAVIGSIILLIVVLCTEDLGTIRDFGFNAWGSIGYFVIFGTVLAFFWYFEGVKEIGAARSGLFINLVPVSGIGLSILILGERPSIWLFVGACLVIPGLLMGAKGIRVPRSEIRGPE